MGEEQQLSLFEKTEAEVNVENSEIPFAFEIGNRVHIIIPAEKLNHSESVFYLQDFINKRGVILKVLEHAKLQYEVEIGNRVAIIYHDELVVGWP